MSRLKITGIATLLVIGTSLSAPPTHAYSTYASWGSSPVGYYLNPTNADVSASAAETAIQVGAGAWGTQSGASIELFYLGRVSDTTTGYDGRNVVLFRNESNGSTIGSTYSWTSNGMLVDADTVYWDGGFTFFTGTTGCAGSNGVYIEDVSTHEFGHMLGMQHSTVTDATMYPSYSTCSEALRTLASDDINGILSLYPASTSTTSSPSTSTTNTAPTVSISSPANGTSATSTTTLTFSGSASDTQDGNLTSKLAWTSSIDGQIGTGSGFSRTLSAGTHTITAQVTDSGGLTSASSISVTISSTSTTSSTSGPTLTAKAYKVKGYQKADLAWSGFTTTSVNIYRDSTLITTTPNDGAYTDSIGSKGSGTHTYKACGTGTSTCSSLVSVSF